MVTTEPGDAVCDGFVARRATSPYDLRACLAIRLAVFVEEQNVPADEEIDAYDDVAIHFVVCREDDGEVVATARLIDRGEGVGKIGRVAVLRSHRRQGVGALLMQRVENEAATLGMRRLVLDSQVTAIPFYERLGYVAEGPVFLDAGIDHRRMAHSIGPDTY